MKPFPSKRLHSKKAMCIRYTLENDLYVVIISDGLDTLRPLTVFQIHPGEEACHNNNLGHIHKNCHGGSEPGLHSQHLLSDTQVPCRKPTLCSNTEDDPIVLSNLNPVDIAFFYLCLEHHKRLRQLFLSETRQKLQAHSSIRCQLLGEKSRKRLTQAVSVHGFQQITGWLQRQHLHDTLLIPLTGQEHHRRRRQFVG